MAQWNAEGLRNFRVTGLPKPNQHGYNLRPRNTHGRHPGLQVFLKQNDMDIICVQETHLEDTHGFLLRGYVLYSQDREIRTKGDTVSLVKNSPSKRNRQIHRRRSGTSYSKRQRDIYHQLLQSKKKQLYTLLKKLNLKKILTSPFTKLGL